MSAHAHLFVAERPPATATDRDLGVEVGHVNTAFPAAWLALFEPGCATEPPADGGPRRVWLVERTDIALERLERRRSTILDALGDQAGSFVDQLAFTLEHLDRPWVAMQLHDATFDWEQPEGRAMLERWLSAYDRADAKDAIQSYSGMDESSPSFAIHVVGSSHAEIHAFEPNRSPYGWARPCVDALFASCCVVWPEMPRIPSLGDLLAWLRAACADGSEPIILETKCGRSIGPSSYAAHLPQWLSSIPLIAIAVRDIGFWQALEGPLLRGVFAEGPATIERVSSGSPPVQPSDDGVWQPSIEPLCRPPSIPQPIVDDEEDFDGYEQRLADAGRWVAAPDWTWDTERHKADELWRSKSRAEILQDLQLAVHSGLPFHPYLGELDHTDRELCDAVVTAALTSADTDAVVSRSAALRRASALVHYAEAHPNAWVRARLARWYTGDSTLPRLARGPFDTSAGRTEEPTPEDPTWRRLASDPCVWVRAALGDNEMAPPTVRAQLSGDTNLLVAASTGDTTAQLRLAFHPEPQVRALVAAKLPESMLVAMAREDDPTVLESLAQRHDAPIVVYEMLLTRVPELLQCSMIRGLGSHPDTDAAAALLQRLEQGASRRVVRAVAAATKRLRARAATQP